MEYIEITLQIINKEGDILPTKNKVYVLEREDIHECYRNLLKEIPRKIQRNPDKFFDILSLNKKYGIKGNLLPFYSLEVEISLYSKEEHSEELLNADSILYLSAGKLAELSDLFKYIDGILSDI